MRRVELLGSVYRALGASWNITSVFFVRITISDPGDAHSTHYFVVLNVVIKEMCDS